MFRVLYCFPEFHPSLRLLGVSPPLFHLPLSVLAMLERSALQSLQVCIGILWPWTEQMGWQPFRINWLWLKPQSVMQGPADGGLSLPLAFLLHHLWLTPWHADARKKPGTPVWFFSAYWDVLGLHTCQWGKHIYHSRCSHHSGCLSFLPIPSKWIPKSEAGRLPSAFTHFAWLGELGQDEETLPQGELELPWRKVKLVPRKSIFILKYL